MTVPPANTLVAYINRKYPYPKVDPEWVRQCVEALVEDGRNVNGEAVLEQYLYSDFSTSTLPLPQPLNPHKTHLFPQPTLLQLDSLTEIASSAFQLQTTLEQRRDVIEGKTKIRGMDDGDAEGEEGGGGEEIDDGKIPAYPRGMLKFGLGDGRWVMKGMEYRRMDEFRLGETMLGAKLLVHNVKVLRGILLLTPDNCQLITTPSNTSYFVEHLEAEQPTQFVQSLQDRLQATPQVAPAPPAQRRLTLPQGQLPTIPSRNRNTATGTSTSTSTSARGRTTTGTTSRVSIPPPPAPHAPATTSGRRPTRTARQAAETKINNLYSTPIAIDSEDEDDVHLVPRGRAGGQRVKKDEYDLSDDFVDDSFLRQVDAIAASQVGNGGGSGGGGGGGRGNGGGRGGGGGKRGYYEIDEDDEDEDEFGEFDESALRQVEEVERRNGSGRVSQSGSGSRSRSRSRGGGSGAGLFDYDDDEEDDKENQGRGIIEFMDSD